MIELFIDLPNISLLYLAGSAGLGGLCRLRRGDAAAVFSALAYNFFFIHPVSTFTIAEPHEVFALFIFLGRGADLPAAWPRG